MDEKDATRHKKICVLATEEALHSIRAQETIDAQDLISVRMKTKWARYNRCGDNQLSLSLYRYRFTLLCKYFRLCCSYEYYLC